MYDQQRAERVRRLRRHAAIQSRAKLYGPRADEHELKRATLQIGLMVFFYFILGVLINIVDPEYLVAAWLFAGALAAAIYFTRKAHKPAINV